MLKLHGMQIAGNGGYDLGRDHLHGHVEGHDILLSKFATVQKAKTDFDGVAECCGRCEWNDDAAGVEGECEAGGATYQGQGDWRGCDRGA